ncbi:SRPBCC family protein [Glycocaulis sp.]|uniref:SRPBCC family protein n=1 Tax=Glycocaulis sp. TaxID=1969725 RepID=UPI003D233DC9
MHHLHKHDDHRHAAGAAAAGAVALAALVGGYVATRMMARRRHTYSSPEDAPDKTLKGHPARGWREDTVVGRTVTINRPRAELYAFWRDFSNLPKFMEHVHSAEQLDDGRTRWVVKSPMGSLEFETRITEEREGELIAWESDPDAKIRNSGRIEFRDAPGGRGTQVDATIAYDAPGGGAGRLIAKLFQKEPKIQARRELKRFKQLMETGEIANGDIRGEPVGMVKRKKAAAARQAAAKTAAKPKTPQKAKSTPKQKN